MSDLVVCTDQAAQLFLVDDRIDLPVCRLPVGAVLPASLLEEEGLQIRPAGALSPIDPANGDVDIGSGVRLWIDALARIVAESVDERADELRPPAVLNEEGREVVLPDGGTVIATGETLWVEWQSPADSAAAEHTIAWGGVKLYPDLPPMPVPLPAACGLSVDGPAHVASIDAASFLASLPGRTALGVASRAMLRVALVHLSRHEARRDVRRAHRRRRMMLDFQRSLGDFEPLLRQRFKRRLPEVQSQPPVIRAACRVLEASDVKPFTDFAASDEESVADVLARFAADSSVRLRPVRLEPEGELATPLLVFIAPEEAPLAERSQEEGDEPMPFALLRDWRGLYLEIPDGEGRRVRLSRALRARLVPGAYAFHPTLPSGKLDYGDILRFGFRYARRSLVEIAAWGVLAALVGLASPVAFGMVIGTVVPSRDTALLVVLVAALGVALAVSAVSRFASEIATLRLDGRLGLLVHGAMVDRLMRLPAAAWRSQPSLILATQLETVEKFRRGITQQIILGGLAGTQLLVTALFLLAYNPRAGLIALALCVALLVVAWIVGRRQFEAIYEGERIDVIVLAFVYDLMRLLPVLRASGGERLAFTQWAQNFLAFQSRLFRSARITNLGGIFEAGWEVAIYLAVFAAIALTARSGSADSVAAAAVAVTFVTALEKLVQASRGMAHAVTAGAKLLPQAKLARSFIEHTLEVPGGRVPVRTLSGDVQFAHASFSYGTQAHGAQVALNDVSFHIAPGSFVGIVGPSGSGKSTLLRLLLGLEEPQSGDVLLDGRPLGSLDRRLVRRQIGAVLQHSRPFPGSIFENIRGATSIGLDDAWRLADLAGIGGELRALPMGLHTLVGEDGAGFAGGQIQRLLLARALAGNPRLLLLDEATSGLDEKAQRHFVSMLRGLACTRVMVTHRFAPLAGCDEILVMDRGSIVQRGTFEELAHEDGLFRAQLERQRPIPFLASSSSSSLWPARSTHEG